MYINKKTIFVSTILLFHANLFANGKPTWCNIAKSNVEHRICDNSKFWSYDEELVRVYNSALIEISNSEKSRLKKSERLWWKLRNRECSYKSDDCIVKYYNDRINIIKSKYLGYNIRNVNSNSNSQTVQAKATQQNIQKTIKQSQPVKKESKAKSGTGFFVTNNQVVTNYHVVEGCSNITVKRNGYITTANINSKDPRNDLSILNVDDKNDYYLTFRSGDKRVRRGEDVYIMGYPLGEYLSANINSTVGMISSLNGAKNDSTKYQISASTYHGNSGSPMLDSYGGVVGVIYGAPKGIQTKSFAIKANTVRMFLNNSDIEYKINNNNEKRDKTDIFSDNNIEKAIVQVICE